VPGRVHMAGLTLTASLGRSTAEISYCSAWSRSVFSFCAKPCRGTAAGVLVDERLSTVTAGGDYALLLVFASSHSPCRETSQRQQLKARISKHRTRASNYSNRCITTPSVRISHQCTKLSLKWPLFGTRTPRKPVADQIVQCSVIIEKI
jgi:hypothetical protein